MIPRKQNNQPVFDLPYIEAIFKEKFRYSKEIYGLVYPGTNLTKREWDTKIIDGVLIVSQETHMYCLQPEEWEGIRVQGIKFIRIENGSCIYEPCGEYRLGKFIDYHFGDRVYLVEEITKGRANA